MWHYVKFKRCKRLAEGSNLEGGLIGCARLRRDRIDAFLQSCTLYLLLTS